MLGPFVGVPLDERVAQEAHDLVAGDRSRRLERRGRERDEVEGRVLHDLVAGDRSRRLERRGRERDEVEGRVLPYVTPQQPGDPARKGESAEEDRRDRGISLVRWLVEGRSV